MKKIERKDIVEKSNCLKKQIIEYHDVLGTNRCVEYLNDLTEICWEMIDPTKYEEIFENLVKFEEKLINKIEKLSKTQSLC